jgi:molecular chaperone GrpE
MTGHHSGAGAPAPRFRGGEGRSHGSDEAVSGRAKADAPGQPDLGAPLTAGAGEPDAAVSADLEEMRRELAQRSDQLLRLAADFENFKRRKAQELADRTRYASEDAARALLPVLDNLRRALDHGPGDAEQLHDGLRMVVSQFDQALRAIGVEPVEAVGAPFDPAIHEAIGGEESDRVSEDTVVAEVQPGYRLLDRLLRPALVRVAHPRPARDPGSTPAGPVDPAL